MKKEKEQPEKNDVQKGQEMNTDKAAPETARKRDVLKNTGDSDLGGFGTDQHSDPVLTKTQ